MLRPYDLEREPPWRFILAPQPGGATLFGLGCHHIVSDLHSMALAVGELEAIYAGREAPQAEPEPYEAFVDWQGFAEPPVQ